MDRLPLIDLRAAPEEVARGIGDACRAHGFFYVLGHGIDESLGERLEDLSHRFFALPETTKERFAMPLGGRAWRGWFALGGELTSGRPDWKEGLYLGTELDETHPRVMAGVPLHGRNLIPGDDLLPGLRQTVLEWIAHVSALGQRVMQGIAGSLDLPADYFASRYTANPLILFRIFQYPSRSVPQGLDVRDGVGEHTDYGLLTLLRQDSVGGLQVHAKQGWIEAPPVPQSFVCNIGDCTRARRIASASTPAAAIGSPSRSSSTPTSTPASRRSAAPPPTTTPRAGTVRACTPSQAPTATTSSARSARCSRSSAANCGSGPASAAAQARPAIRRHDAGVADGSAGQAAQVPRRRLIGSICPCGPTPAQPSTRSRSTTTATPSIAKS
jgi:isopenicillin N synthase-like dioxygenase